MHAHLFAVSGRPDGLRSEIRVNISHLRQEMAPLLGKVIGEMTSNIIVAYC